MDRQRFATRATMGDKGSPLTSTSSSVLSDIGVGIPGGITASAGVLDSCSNGRAVIPHCCPCTRAHKSGVAVTRVLRIRTVRISMVPNMVRLWFSLQNTCIALLPKAHECDACFLFHVRQTIGRESDYEHSDHVNVEVSRYSTGLFERALLVTPGGGISNRCECLGAPRPLSLAE